MMDFFPRHHMFKSLEFTEDFTGNSITSHRSLMAMRKSVTEMLEPWVTPLSCLNTKKRKLLRFTWNVLSDRKFIIILLLLKSILYNYSRLPGSVRYIILLYRGIVYYIVFFTSLSLVMMVDHILCYWFMILFFIRSLKSWAVWMRIWSESGEVIDSF